MTTTDDKKAATDREIAERTLATAKALPDAGEGRWWRVAHNPKSRTNPITVTLMEAQVRNLRSLSRPLGFEYCIASPKSVAEAAGLVLARHADYLTVVGDYGGE